jgi:hypothetical protein
MSVRASIPHTRVSLIDNQGRITPEWYRFLAQFQRDFSGSETVPGSGLTDDGGVLGIAANGVTNAMLAEGLACSVIGRTLNSTGDRADIQATNDGYFLQRDGTNILFRIPKLPSYTVAGVPNATDVEAGTIIYVSNEAGGAVVAFSDATNWRRLTDRAIIS